MHRSPDRGQNADVGFLRSRFENSFRALVTASSDAMMSFLDTDSCPASSCACSRALCREAIPAAAAALSCSSMVCASSAASRFSRTCSSEMAFDWYSFWYRSASVCARLRAASACWICAALSLRKLSRSVCAVAVTTRLRSRSALWVSFDLRRIS